MKRRFRYVAVAAVMAPLLGLGGCETVNPATGKSDFTPFMSSARESRIGAEEHPKILLQFGGVYDDPQIGAYVASIGGRLAANSELSQSPFRVTLLDSPIVNAFALPGGYLYVTRGLLALANSEAELAGVLAHEIGHVTARHSAQRYNRAVVAGIGSLLLGAVIGNSVIQDLAQEGSKLYLAGFSRKQEFEADKLGVRYLARTGYDPYAEADFLATMGRNSALEAKLAGKKGSGGGGFLATHPGTADRVRKAIAAAGGGSIKPHDRPRHRDRFLDMLDGMAYGDSPEKGIVDGRTFAHPKLGFTFTAPPRFTVSNSDEAVIAKGPGDSYVVFDGARVSSRTSMIDYLARDWGAKAGLESVQSLSINGMEAATGRTRTTGQIGTFDIRYVAIRFDRGQAYRFQFLSRPAATADLSVDFQRTTFSFRRLSEAEAGAFRGQRVRVITVRSGDTMAAIAAGMPFADHRVERLRALNGMAPGQPLRTGQRLKIIAMD